MDRRGFIKFALALTAATAIDPSVPLDAMAGSHQPMQPSMPDIIKKQLIQQGCRETEALSQIAARRAPLVEALNVLQEMSGGAMPIAESARSGGYLEIYPGVSYLGYEKSATIKEQPSILVTPKSLTMRRHVPVGFFAPSMPRDPSLTEQGDIITFIGKQAARMGLVPDTIPHALIGKMSEPVASALAKGVEEGSKERHQLEAQSAAAKDKISRAMTALALSSNRRIELRSNPDSSGFGASYETNIPVRGSEYDQPSMRQGAHFSLNLDGHEARSLDATLVMKYLDQGVVRGTDACLNIIGVQAGRSDMVDSEAAEAMSQHSDPVVRDMGNAVLQGIEQRLLMDKAAYDNAKPYIDLLEDLKKGAGPNVDYRITIQGSGHRVIETNIPMSGSNGFGTNTISIYVSRNANDPSTASVGYRQSARGFDAIAPVMREQASKAQPLKEPVTPENKGLFARIRRGLGL